MGVPPNGRSMQEILVHLILFVDSIKVSKANICVTISEDKRLLDQQFGFQENFSSKLQTHGSGSSSAASRLSGAVLSTQTR